jgi:hypothetical protein
MVSCGVQDNKRIAALPFSHGCPKMRLIALTPEIDYDQTAVGSPPVKTVVFLIAKSFW